MSEEPAFLKELRMLREELEKKYPRKPNGAKTGNVETGEVQEKWKK